MNRSGAKWLPGAMALAATAASTQAAVVQITLTGNKISSTGGNQLVADLTGDTVADVAITRAVTGPYTADVRINGSPVFASRGMTSFSVDAQFAPGGVGVAGKILYSFIAGIFGTFYLIYKYVFDNACIDTSIFVRNAIRDQDIVKMLFYSME